MTFKEIVFSSDTKHRKQWFTGLSFSHPGKMMLPLQLYLIDRYTQPRDIILDPMAGSGTLLVACSLGRHVICVELEQKFVDMQKGNWEKIQQRGPQMGYQMGTATILQGDARNLAGILADKIDAVVTSPPYEGSISGIDEEAREREKDWLRRQGKNPDTHSCIVNPSQYSAEGNNIGNLKSQSYLEAMLQVYQQCYEVLRPQGLMILVTKDFIRNKQRVFLSIDTIKLCEQAGFVLEDWHERKLTQQSFWRVIYRQKFPDAPVIDYEDVLVFKKLKV